MNGLMKFEVPMTKVISKGNMGMDLMYNPCQETMLFRPLKVRNIIPKAQRVVYNNPATIVFWEDGTKTVVKAMGGDVFDPERGYLQAFFEKASENNSSRTQCNKFLISLRKQYEDSLKDKETKKK